MEKLRGADGVRAMACFMVILHHMCQRLDYNALIRNAEPGVQPVIQFLQGLVPVGMAGVSIFFVLSGFLLAHPFWEAYLSKNPLPSLPSYAIRRAGRIIPGYYLALATCFFLTLFLLPETNGNGESNAPALFWRYLMGLSFTSGFHWMSFFPTGIDGPLWSISFEVVSYLLMPLGMVGLFRLSRPPRFWKGFLWWCALLGVTFVVNQLIVSNIHLGEQGLGVSQLGLGKGWMPRYNPIGLFAHFALGILASGITARLARSKWSAARTKSGFYDRVGGFVLLGLVILCISRSGQSDFSLNFQDQPYYYPWFAGLIALLLICLSQSTSLARRFEHPVLRYTATVSFGLYIWHYVVLELVQHFAVYDYYYYGMRDVGRWALTSLVSLALAFLVASLSWFFLEKPVLRAAQKWRPREAGEAARPGRRRWLILAIGVLLVALPLGSSILRPYAFEFPPPWFESPRQ